MKLLEQLQFEGACNPYPFAAFRIAFYAGVIVHFAPSLLTWSENYGPLAYRLPRWSETLFALFPSLPQSLLQMAALLTLLGCFWGLVGFLPRVSAIIAGAGLYVFASFNALHTSTLALVSVWAIFPLLAIGGGGDEVWSAGNVLLKRPPRPGERWARTLIVTTLMAGFFFAGIEKVLAGWLADNPMHRIMQYPAGFVLREWAVGNPLLLQPWVGKLLGLVTVALEITLPLAMLFGRTRIAAVILFELLFVGIFAVLEVPPLFGFLYGGAGLLALQDADLEKLGRLRPMLSVDVKQAPHQGV